MKAVMLAMRYLTNAFGNIIDVAVIALLEGKLGSQVGSKIRTFFYALNNLLWIIETTFHVAFIFIYPYIGVRILFVCRCYGFGYDIAGMDGYGIYICRLYYRRGSGQRRG